MNPHKFIYPLLVLDDGGRPQSLAGCGFPVTPTGDLVTCRHVAQRLDEKGNLAGIGIFDAVGKTIHRAAKVDVPDWPNLDLAVIPRAFGSDVTMKDYLPVLDPSELKIGEDVYTWGAYQPRPGLENLRYGYFKGSLVNIEPGSMAVKQTPYQRLLLPFPVIEGLSGSPLLTYHAGVKLVGVCYGNEPLRVKAYEVTETRDGDSVYREETHRIVEYGLAHPGNLLTAWLQDAGYRNFTVSAGRIDNPELG